VRGKICTAILRNEYTDQDVRDGGTRAHVHVIRRQACVHAKNLENATNRWYVPYSVPVRTYTGQRNRAGLEKREADLLALLGLLRNVR